MILSRRNLSVSRRFNLPEEEKNESLNFDNMFRAQDVGALAGCLYAEAKKLADENQIELHDAIAFISMSIEVQANDLEAQQFEWKKKQEEKG